MISDIRQDESANSIRIHFSDYFGVAPAALDASGVVNVSLFDDLPLFIDPSLLFQAERAC